MIIIMILIGALVVGVAFESLESAFLGGFLGFLLARSNQLSNQISQLNKQVSQLNLKLKKLTSEKAPTIPENQTNLSKPASDTSFATHSTAKQPERTAPSIQTTATKESVLAAATEPQQPEQKIQNANGPASQPRRIAQPSSAGQQTIQKKALPEPDIISKTVGNIVNFVIGYFTQGNVVVRVGAVILFFGVAFLLKYAAENSNISMQTRLITVAVGAIVMLTFGWRLRNKRQGYGLILQGTAVGILYLTLFAGFRLYSLVPAGFAFTLLFIFSGLAMLLAVLQDSRSLAVLSVTGGFLAPVLTSTGSGSHVSLFTYYSILNLGIFAVAWFKSWRLLNIIGFAFTFIIGTAWGITKYQVADFSTTEPFLIFFFVLYSAIALLFANKYKTELKGYLDATLVFGLPLVCFSLQSAMVKDFEYGLAWSAFGLGAFYIGAAALLLRGVNKNWHTIAEAYLALGIIFVSLVIPFALDGEWTAASWAIEGAGLIWVGLRQDRWFAKYFGALIQFAGGVFFFSDIGGSGSIANKNQLFDSTMLGIIFVAVAALFSSFQIFIRKDSLRKIEASSAILFLIWGMLWWYIGGISQIVDHLSHANETKGILLFITISGIIWFILEQRFAWKVLRQMSWVTFITSVITAFIQLITYNHLLMEWDSIFWILVIASFYGVLKRREMRLLGGGSNLPAKSNLPIGNSILHFSTFIALLILSFHELSWLMTFLAISDGWSLAAIGLLGCLWLFLLGAKSYWPIAQHLSTYQVSARSVVLVGSIFWSLLLNFPNSGDASPLTYLPILNPLDIIQGLLLIFMIKGFKDISTSNARLSFDLDSLKVLLGLFIFAWLNVILLRSIHAWKAIAYSPDALFSSFFVQTALSIFWTIIGLAGTIFASKIASRRVWIIAAGLIGVVVVKLFFVDLANSSSIERIVSFVVVGLLLLIVGYFSPMPSKDGKSASQEDSSD